MSEGDTAHHDNTLAKPKRKAKHIDNLMSVLKEMNKQNEAANLTSAELLKIMRGGTPSIASPNPGTSTNGMTVGNATTNNSETELNRTMCEMQGTDAYIEETKKKLKKLKEKKAALTTDGSEIDKVKKVRGLDNEIQDVKKTIKPF